MIPVLFNYFLRYIYVGHYKDYELNIYNHVVLVGRVTFRSFNIKA